MAARLITGAVGGWGDPEGRPRNLVLAELITEDVARRIYGLTDADLARL